MKIYYNIITIVSRLVYFLMAKYAALRQGCDIISLRRNMKINLRNIIAAVTLFILTLSLAFGGVIVGLSASAKPQPGASFTPSVTAM